MPKVSPIKEGMLYKEVMKGKSARKAMIDADFSERTAHNATNSKVYKKVVKHCIEDFKLSQITPEYVISHIDSILQSDCSPSDKLRASELLGKFLAIFKDKAEITHKDDLPSLITDDQLEQEIDKVMALRRTSVKPLASTPINN